MSVVMVRVPLERWRFGARSIKYERSFAFVIRVPGSLMKTRATPDISARKRPKQARSERLVADILEAAVRVLAREGARRFTTVRVAEEAGVSVGSLYQYFPNKEALLFRLQADEWKETGDILGEILADPKRAPLDRVRRAVRTFFRSEREEAELRVALGDAGALYRDAPETREHRAMVTEQVLAFMAEALPRTAEKERAFAAEFVMTSMSAIGKRITEEPRSQAEIDRWAEAFGQMCCDYLERLDREAKRPAK
ncbi:MAG: TetR family transcriptional regulator [Minicystis sp.]